MAGGPLSLLFIATAFACNRSGLRAGRGSKVLSHFVKQVTGRFMRVHRVDDVGRRNLDRFSCVPESPTHTRNDGALTGELGLGVASTEAAGTQFPVSAGTDGMVLGLAPEAAGKLAAASIIGAAVEPRRFMHAPDEFHWTRRPLVSCEFDDVW